MNKAIVAKISKIEDIEGANTIQVGYVLGERVILSKDWSVGDTGILFQEGLQLSEDFAAHNNLYRHSHLNADNTKKGFFEDNRRVRSQPFMKIRSDAFFIGLDSLNYIKGFDANTLAEGTHFDEINGVKVCEKYIVHKAKVAQSNKMKKTKVDYAPSFLKHVNTEQFKYYVGSIEKGSLISLHAKKHGTSFRVGNLPVLQDLPWWKRVMNKIANVFPEYDYGLVVGTRNVVIDNPDKEGFHGSEQYRFDIANQIAPHLDEGMTVYGEIVGYANGKSIMPNGDVTALRDKAYVKKYGKVVEFKYTCQEGEYKFHIYRITLQHGDTVIDFSDKQLKEWCLKNGFTPTYDVHEPFIYDGNQEALIELVENLTERPECLTEDFIDHSMISEGIIIRVDNHGLTPKFYKSKSYAFKVMEGICEQPDEESMS